MKGYIWTKTKIMFLQCNALFHSLMPPVLYTDCITKSPTDLGAPGLRWLCSAY